MGENLAHRADLPHRTAGAVVNAQPGSNQPTDVIFKGVARRVLTALFDAPQGLLETQLAASTATQIERVHRLVNELALNGIVVHEDASTGYLVRVNPHSEKATALRVLLESPEAHRLRTDLATRLGMVGTHLSVAVAWWRGVDVIVLATVADEIDPERMTDTRAHIVRQLTPSFPEAPEVVIYRWSSYRQGYADGNKQIRRVWRSGFQILGRDPLTRDAALQALRARALLLADVPDAPIETGGRFY